MINVSFSQQELQALLQIMDLGVKQGGLAVVGPAAAIQQKFAMAMRGPVPEEERVVTKGKKPKLAPVEPEPEAN